MAAAAAAGVVVAAAAEAAAASEPRTHFVTDATSEGKAGAASPEAKARAASRFQEKSMDRLVEGFARFREHVYPRQSALYETLAREGQKPQALVISCSDSRVMPEVVLQTDPGEIFVTRNAGNIVPRHGSEAVGAVTSAIEFAVTGLGVRHIVVCGHTDCGAMKALLKPEALKAMPAVGQWLRQCDCVREGFVCEDGESDEAAARRIAMRNVATQVKNLKTHPAVAGGLADGTLKVHGWLFDIAAGQVLALDAVTGAFRPLRTDRGDSAKGLAAAA